MKEKRAGTRCRNPGQPDECFSIEIRTSWLRVHPAPRPSRIPMRTNYGLTSIAHWLISLSGYCNASLGSC
jgi:hypothetical protein